MNERNKELTLKNSVVNCFNIVWCLHVGSPTQEDQSDNGPC